MKKYPIILIPKKNKKKYLRTNSKVHSYLKDIMKNRKTKLYK